MGKIYVIFIELCMNLDLLSTLRGNNPYNKHAKLYNVRNKWEMWKWSIAWLYKLDKLIDDLHLESLISIS